MPREPRNVGASVRARLLARARAEKTDYQILLTRYALERLLYRLSVSTHRDGFILRGALLFVTWLHGPFRPTRELDLPFETLAKAGLRAPRFQRPHSPRPAGSRRRSFLAARTILSAPVFDILKLGNLDAAVGEYGSDLEIASHGAYVVA